MKSAACGASPCLLGREAQPAATSERRLTDTLAAGRSRQAPQLVGSAEFRSTGNSTFLTHDGAHNQARIARIFSD